LPRAPRGDHLPTYYNHLSIEFRRDFLLAGARVQNFASPDIDVDYSHFSQRYLEASWRWVNFRAGNSFAIIGRGILLRSFELPGFLYEDPERRQRHGVIRDIDGWRATLTPGPFEIMALSGRPVDPLEPPNEETRRLDKIRGAQASVRLHGNVRVGGGYLEFHENSALPLATRFAQFSLKPAFAAMGLRDLDADFYAEYATIQGKDAFGKFDAKHPHAFYFSGTLAYAAWGGCFEYKDYRDFALGINDPPSLVRENSEVLLNRATHVLLAEAEQGIQAEISLAPRPAWRVTANYSAASNDLHGPPPTLRYTEKMLAIEWFGDPLTGKIFVDASRDDILFERERFTSGIAGDYHFTGGSTVGADLQWQRIRRAASGFFDYEFTNFYSALKLGGWKKFSFSAQLERSSDPFETATVKYWPGAGIGWQPDSRIALQFFGGKRRGGNACDHGYCIQVQPFSGIELRMQTNW
jgi:hypothetical protein